MIKKNFYGTGRLIRFNFRKDRIHIIFWLFALLGITLSYAYSYPSMFSSEAERQIMAQTLNNPAMTAMLGPISDPSNYNYGVLFSHEMLLFTVAAVAIMNILFVARHTRMDEEEGRLEMIRSFPVGRLSTLASTIVELFIINILITILHGIGLGMLGIESMDYAGSFLYGAALGAVGFAFAAITCFCVQLMENNRNTTGIAFGILGFSFLFRAVTDINAPKLSWLSPLSWSYKMEPYAGNRMLPVFISLVFSFIVISISLYLNSIRDLGKGFIPQKSGRAYASKSLISPFGLAFRLQRTGFITWIIVMFILGLTFGSIFGDLDAFFKENDVLARLIPQSNDFKLTDQFIGLIMSIISIMATIPVIMFLFKLWQEEKSGRLEALVSKSLSKINIFISFLSISILFLVIGTFISTLGLYLSANAVLQDPLEFSMLIKAALVFIPSITFILALGSFIIGYLPKLTGILWGYLGYCFFAIFLGDLMQLPEELKKLTSFYHIPKLPVEEVTALPLVILTILSFLLTILGIIRYRGRNIEQNA
ncbi:MAG: ABC transporter permease [Clostridiales bacterium]|nr:ABC transporter permease [Clostridiales bacterium]